MLGVIPVVLASLYYYQTGHRKGKLVRWLRILARIESPPLSPLYRAACPVLPLPLTEPLCNLPRHLCYLAGAGRKIHRLLQLFRK